MPLQGWESQGYRTLALFGRQPRQSTYVRFPEASPLSRTNSRNERPVLSFVLALREIVVDAALLRRPMALR
jgi:hypothetical protein